jgi:FkbM family methyltransferase
LGVRSFVRDFRRFRNWNEVHGKKTNLWKVRNPHVDVLLRNGTTDSWIAREIFFDKAYTKYFDVQKNDTVVDIGAHIGLFALYAQAKEAARIFAFEPNPANFDALMGNISLNSARNIRPLRVAVFPGVTSTVFHIPTGKDKDKSSAFEIVKEAHEDIRIDCISLDDFANENGIKNIDFMKLDAEGAEHKILAESNCMSTVQKVVVEAHDIDGHPKEEVERQLNKCGFRTKATAAPSDGLTMYVYGWR